MDERNWDMALLAKNPLEAYEELRQAVTEAEEAVRVDDLPNRDWLKA